MAILPHGLAGDLVERIAEQTGQQVWFMNLGAELMGRPDPLEDVRELRRRRDYALQESINTGDAFVMLLTRDVGAYVLALEDRRRIFGGLVGEWVWLPGDSGGRDDAVAALCEQGFSASLARAYIDKLPVCTRPQLLDVASRAGDAFYRLSGWEPELMRENRTRILQQQQLNQAIADQKRVGADALYAFEKERVLLATIRAGDRTGARRILNEMLAAIYMSSPRLVVLRARAIELMSCLTRAAIEDNPLMEPLIQRNHSWTDRLIQAASFESLSGELMRALDDFIDGIYLHGLNRANAKVRGALDYIGRHYAQPLGVDDVARAVKLSASRLSHLVKDYTGKTVIEILHEVRIRQAQRLLERGEQSCAEVAYEVGFGDQSYFIKQFKRVTGTTPGRFRRFRA